MGIISSIALAVGAITAAGAASQARSAKKQRKSAEAEQRRQVTAARENNLQERTAEDTGADIVLGSADMDAELGLDSVTGTRRVRSPATSVGLGSVPKVGGL